MKKKKSPPNRRRRLVFIFASTLVGLVALGIFFQYLFPTVDPGRRITDDFSKTATALIGELTKDATLLTSIADGKTTLTPFEAIVNKWSREIEEHVGFSHPNIRNLVEDLLSQYESDLTAINFAEVNYYFDTYDDANTHYVAIRLSTYARIKHSHETYNTVFAIFKVNNESAELLFKQYPFNMESASRFIDLNKNGSINLFFEYKTEGECSYSRVIILELVENIVHDVSPDIETQPNGIYSRYDFVDKDDDDILDIVLEPFDYSTHPKCEVLDSIVTFKWNGERYERAD